MLKPASGNEPHRPKPAAAGVHKVMMEPESLLPLVLVLGLVGMSLTSARLALAAQPLRLRLAQKGERLVARSDLPTSLRRDVSLMLDDAFPQNVAFLVLAGLLAPIIVFFVMKDVEDRARTLDRLSPELRGSYLELCGLHARLSRANNPVLVAILELEVAIIALFAASAVSFLRKTSEAAFDRDGMIMSIEQRQRDILQPAIRRVA